MYEIEYKVELTADERENLINLFKEKGFAFDGTEQQNDFYTEAKDSPTGFGYDIKRYRDLGHNVIYTEKIWEVVGDQHARKEIENEVTREVFESEIAKYPDAVKIKKQRESFSGTHEGTDIGLMIDSVKFDHSPSMRYFVEAEILSEDKDSIKEIKAKLIDFLKMLLDKEELAEAYGMFTMALKKK